MSGHGVVVERTFEVDSSLDHVWEFLRDPASFSACIPGVSDVEALEDGTFRATVAVTIALLTARFGMSVRIVEERAPYHIVAEMSGEDSRTGTRLETRNTVDLEAVNGGTQVAFQIDARLSGKLAALDGGIAVKLRSRRMAKEFAKEVKRRVESGG